jgi:hypothetical protein
LLLKQGPQHQDGLQDNEEKYLFIVHQLLDTSNVLMKLDGKKFKRILAVRHPFYLFDHWSSYVEMHGASPRDFTVMICKEQPVPWFITKNQDLYYAHSTEEKASIAIVELMAKQREYIRNNADILVIDFEKFVLSPKSYVNRISNLIGESQNSRLNLYMRQSKLPRSHINSSKRMEIYSRYGADLLDNSLTHKADYSKLRSRIKNKVSNKHFELMESVAHDYENDFGLWF